MHACTCMRTHHFHPSGCDEPLGFVRSGSRQGMSTQPSKESAETQMLQPFCSSVLLGTQNGLFTYVSCRLT